MTFHIGSKEDIFASQGSCFYFMNAQDEIYVDVHLLATKKNRRVRKIVVISQMLKNSNTSYIEQFLLLVRKRYLHRNVLILTS